MAEDLSKSQIDRLGERLKAGPSSEDDLRLLDQYRLSFDNVYATVFKAVCQLLREQCPGIEPTGREAKSTGSIVDKLRRESIRLTQIQDIAGCRLVVPNLMEQDRIVALIAGHGERSPAPLFPDAEMIDRRVHPSHGYRAVHVVVKIDGKPFEIQVRSRLQHLWAEISEKLADAIDSRLKYGDGTVSFQKFLALLSEMVMYIEKWEKEILAHQHKGDLCEHNLDLRGMILELEELMKNPHDNLNRIGECLTLMATPIQRNILACVQNDAAEVLDMFNNAVSDPRNQKSISSLKKAAIGVLEEMKRMAPNFEILEGFSKVKNQGKKP